MRLETKASRPDRTGRSGQSRACLRVNPMTRQSSINLGRIPQSARAMKAAGGRETRVVDEEPLTSERAPCWTSSTLTGPHSQEINFNPLWFPWGLEEPGHTCLSLKTWWEIECSRAGQNRPLDPVQEEIQVKKTAATGIKA